MESLNANGWSGEDLDPGKTRWKD